MSDLKTLSISREILQRYHRYNYLTVDDFCIAALHYVEPVKVDGKWVHLGKTYGESLILVLDGLYDTKDSDKIIVRYHLYDFKYDSLWLDIKRNKLCILKDAKVEYDITDGYSVLYIGDLKETYLSKSYMFLHLEKPDIIGDITINSCWLDDFGVEYNINAINYRQKEVIENVTISNTESDRRVLSLYEFLRDYKFNKSEDKVVYNMDNGYCCKNCVMVDDVYMMGNEPYKVTGIGSKQSISLYNGYSGEKSTVSFIDFKRRYEKFDLGSINTRDKWVSIYGGSDTYTIINVDIENETVLLSHDVKTKTCNNVQYSILTLLSRYKPCED